MPAISTSAPGKIILFGEHAVVYGSPAIAVPFFGVHAKAAIFAMPIAPKGQVRIEAQAIHLDATLDQLDPEDPFALAIMGVMEKFSLERLPAMHIRITSTIPIAAGMGSSAAVSVAIVRALSTFLGHPLPNEETNAIAYQIEQRQHGSPSGVDNSVITYGKPVYFVRNNPIEFLQVAKPYEIIVADSGNPSATGPMVEGVRQRYLSDPVRYGKLFTQITDLVNLARESIENGEINQLGGWMTKNHAILEEIGVSTPYLNTLVEAALQGGASGAKLTGGGGGGNIIAIANEDRTPQVESTLLAAGARQIWRATVSSPLEPTP